MLRLNRRPVNRDFSYFFKIFPLFLATGGSKVSVKLWFMKYDDTGLWFSSSETSCPGVYGNGPGGYRCSGCSRSLDSCISCRLLKFSGFLPFSLPAGDLPINGPKITPLSSAIMLANLL
jgi:hypothetical protein